MMEKLREMEENEVWDEIFNTEVQLLWDLRAIQCRSLLDEGDEVKDEMKKMKRKWSEGYENEVKDMKVKWRMKWRKWSERWSEGNENEVKDMKMKWRKWSEGNEDEVNDIKVKWKMKWRIGRWRMKWKKWS